MRAGAPEVPTGHGGRPRPAPRSRSPTPPRAAAPLLLLLLQLLLMTNLSVSMTNPESLPSGLQCDFEDESSCGWQWKSDIPGEVTFVRTTGRRLTEISMERPAGEITGVIMDAERNPEGEYLA